MNGDAAEHDPRDSLLVLLNPQAGRGRARRREAELRAALTTAGLAFDLTRTTHPGQARELAARHRGPRILAVGGDGTVHEVVNGLADARATGRGQAALAVLASGSGDDFATAAGLPTSTAGLIAVLREGKTQQVDLGQVEYQTTTGTQREVFTNNLGLGLQAEVDRAARHLRWLRGPALYLTATLAALARHRPPQLTITHGDPNQTDTTTTSTLLLSLCNGPKVGGGIGFAPAARLDDGRLHSLQVAAVSRRRALRLLAMVKGGRHVDQPEVSLRRLTSLSIATADEISLTIDGELRHQVRHLRVEVLPRALRLCGPRPPQPS